MSETKDDGLSAWIQEMERYRLPRWEELPDLELYMDQVITLIERYLSPLVGQADTKVITAAMINNYVKLNIMPKPNKKRYERIHMAYLMVITILKQVLLIPEIKDGIFLQSNIHGISKAYNLFCQEQEAALQTMVQKSRPSSQDSFPAVVPIAPERLGLHMACLSFASKIFTEKIIFWHMQSNSTYPQEKKKV